MNETSIAPRSRVDWIDYAKGICIIAVVAFYATGYVEELLKSAGWMGYFAEFACPFRMPDFFLVSGLFVARVIDRPWRSYLDTKVVHFLYFYALWVTIKFLLLTGGAIVGPNWEAHLVEYGSYYLQPSGPLWFIYMLPWFFIAVRLVRSFPVWLVLSAVIALKLVDLDTGWKLIDRFGMYFIYFYVGHVFANRIFALAAWAQRHPGATIGALLCWAVANALWVGAGLPFVAWGHLLTGIAGAAAVILFSTLLTRLNWMRWLRYLGENSIVVFLAFVVPLNVLRRFIAAYPLPVDSGTVAFTASAVSILGALMLWWAVRGTPLRFLFKRPEWAKLEPSRTILVNTVLKREGMES